MKQALKAFSPAEKIYNIQRIHSKLIHLSSNKSAMTDKFSENMYTVDMILNALEKSTRCFMNEVETNKMNRKLKNYLYSIKQTRSHVKRSRDGEWHACKVCFCYMAGMFAILKRKTRNRILQLCELEYQEICVPMYKLDKTYIKKSAPKAAYK